ncbi:MAG: hypothetical protein JW814_03435 [Candidatus Krumholzibacteriota bacterium]|nr:hypothetical protein [Candidatus Krumholzibacteriota bacterium]
MRTVKISALALLLVLASVAVANADGTGRIYGKITTVDGDRFEGLIRWDKNEGAWIDFLNGNKELSKRHRSSRGRYQDRKKRITIFGILLGYTDSDNYYSSSAQSGIRMGHIESIEVVDDDVVMLTLKSGNTLELNSGSTDIGTANREIVIEDENEGEIGFDWDDLERIDFMQAPAGLKSIFGERLYGTVKTRRDDEFSGWIAWDIDEAFESDVIDGKQDHRNRKIKFSKIASIERHSSDSAIIILKSGNEFRLRGTNDVDDSNRGIIVTDLELGEINIGWDDFDRLDLKSPSAEVRYDAFDGGGYIEGTVFTSDGEEFTGRIRWDNDEEFTWEYIDGDYHDIEMDIEFSNIAEITRKGSRSSVVTLRDGRSFRLRGSNDIDDDNKGIFIETAQGEEVEVDWDEFEKVVFKKR